MNDKKRFKNVILFDIYKNILTEKQQNIFQLYYDNDYSEKEIAKELNVSKQYISKTLKIIEKKLEDYEKKLKLLKKAKGKKNV
ncbi:MAG TPA: sigma factor-like helix-turn-helix DNA-binding protein [bacterium]|nr:sigma factor-like helix-turn-helix DNA-binding protein [bacterium]HOL46939.1 sigma factor-like helix-turn-helix DNA-binding protein [bacterium]HPQ18205.1 sigma factor-like helix-turn-helix DNA-binding protein [bacterium]